MSTSPEGMMDNSETVTPVAMEPLEAQTRGEIDIQVTTARRYPRSIVGAKQKAAEMACLDEETASACIYSLPRAGKPITGPSARFAEIVQTAWGNMRAEARIVSENGKFVTARGIAWDLETNSARAMETRRRITDRTGKTYTDDMIATTSNAACSIAMRNAVLQVVPRAHWWPVYQAARRAAVGDETTLEQRRSEMVAYFKKMGVSEQQVFDAVGVKGLDDITLDYLADLKGIATMIREGDSNIETMFPKDGAEAKPSKPPTGRQKASKKKKAKAEKGKEDEPAPSPDPGPVRTISPSATKVEPKTTTEQLRRMMDLDQEHGRELLNRVMEESGFVGVHAVDLSESAAEKIIQEVEKQAKESPF